MIQKFIEHTVEMREVNPMNLTQYNPDFLFIYKNGIGESPKAMNETMNKFKTVAEARVLTLLQGTYICMAVVAIVYCICCAIIVPKIFEIQTLSSRIWLTLYAVPRGTLVELRRKALDRLRTFHSLDIQSEDAGKISKMRKKPLTDPVWVTLIVLLLMFAGLSLGFYVYIYIQGLSKTTELMLARSTQTQEIYSHKTSLMESWNWAAELVIPVAYPISHVFTFEKEWRTFVSPIFDFNNSYINSRHVRNNVRNNIMSGDLPSNTDIMTSLFEEYNSTLAQLHLGLYAAELDYLEDIKSAVNTYDVANFGPLLMLELEMQNVIDVLTSKVLDEIDDTINYYSEETTWMFSVYCLSAVGFYCAITVPVLRSVNARIRKAWRVASLIPNDVLQTALKKLNKA
mmetsp:Transcript_30029/g.53261  ORF Transcript_30029/g.53261 Transcript_30029/m.53261 type:complete len:399 (+) Transcript_30029:3-1199(+)